MNYRMDKLMIDGHTDTHTHTQATTIPEGQNRPWVKMKNRTRIIQAESHKYSNSKIDSIIQI